MRKRVVVVIGVGGMGEVVARRQGTGHLVLLADFNEATLDKVGESMRDDGYDVIAQQVDVTSRESMRALAQAAGAAGQVVQVVHTAGLHATQAPVAPILEVDLFGVVIMLEEMVQVIADGGAGVVFASMAANAVASLTPEQEAALRTAPIEELRGLPFIQPDAIPDSLTGYGIAKRANQLRVQAASSAWGERGARINSVSPGIISTAQGRRELTGELGRGIQALVDASATGRVGTPEDVANAVAFLLGPQSSFITGTDLLVDGGVIAAMRSGRLATPAQP
ncbi:NAD(P)-dependent dehydrogenase, short-chain alcohol dehydrogenase family [Streptosporangium subroseum]|uniref:NAD(P)-dependent dehydrogenase, short-chain alcohol dehydrogenase family n=1 Tax=Streptosporangium subroseum TaxID=106412 RepID=A0A239PAP7_9ACTN|nr:SDR family oxidoreductase [Streptosporangium subroseum]SNT63754.1 NAD(P)-dependent dehydrogenase, short-chain alcohol dehydrogenase family [Streptosporangium subroseum]